MCAFTSGNNYSLEDMMPIVFFIDDVSIDFSGC